jgi:hypothetical protein
MRESVLVQYYPMTSQLCGMNDNIVSHRLDLRVGGKRSTSCRVFNSARCERAFLFNSTQWQVISVGWTTTVHPTGLTWEWVETVKHLAEYLSQQDGRERSCSTLPIPQAWLESGWKPLINDLAESFFRQEKRESVLVQHYPMTSKP